MVKQSYLYRIISYVNVYVKKKKGKMLKQITTLSLKQQQQKKEKKKKKGENVNDTVLGFYVFS